MSKFGGSQLCANVTQQAVKSCWMPMYWILYFLLKTIPSAIPRQSYMLGSQLIKLCLLNLFCLKVPFSAQKHVISFAFKFVDAATTILVLSADYLNHVCRLTFSLTVSTERAVYLYIYVIRSKYFCKIWKICNAVSDFWAK